jgi:phosphoribosylanthranilate isomerase
MKLTKVTITGADDSTSVESLISLSTDFPFVEWGILVSKKQEGSYRFPSRAWIDEYSAAAEKHRFNTSMHVCGRWVRDMFVGILDWDELPSCLNVCQRVQINTHAEPHLATPGFLDRLEAQREKQFIFQIDGINEIYMYAAVAGGFNVAGLFDKSGGAGILPDSWPQPPYNGIVIPYGYAGGLGPENVGEQVRLIEEAAPMDYWIDMERRVRTPDDSELDLKAVETVLEKMSAYMTTTV